MCSMHSCKCLPIFTGKSTMKKAISNHLNKRILEKDYSFPVTAISAYHCINLSSMQTCTTHKYRLFDYAKSVAFNVFLKRNEQIL